MPEGSPARERRDIGVMDNAMEQFVDYVTQWEPDFANRIRGATSSEIGELEKLAGRPLPQTYRAYLSRLGRNDGGLDIGQTATTEIKQVIDFYREALAAGDSLPLDCIVIAVGGVGVGETSLQIRSTDEPRVVDTSDDRIEGLYAESLPILVYRISFMKYRARCLPYSAIYVSTGEDNELAEGQSTALALGFVLQWFSDSICICGERSDAVFMLNQFEGRTPWLRIAATERKRVEDIGEGFARSIGVRFQRWWP